MYVYLILSNIGNKPLFQWRQYASQLLKAGDAAQPKGLLRLLCSGSAENVKQPGFSGSTEKVG